MDHLRALLGDNYTSNHEGDFDTAIAILSVNIHDLISNLGDSFYAIDDSYYYVVHTCITNSWPFEITDEQIRIGQQDERKGKLVHYKYDPNNLPDS